MAGRAPVSVCARRVFAQLARPSVPSTSSSQLRLFFRRVMQGLVTVTKAPGWHVARERSWRGIIQVKENPPNFHLQPTKTRASVLVTVVDSSVRALAAEVRVR